MTDTPLLDWIPPFIAKGATFDGERDSERLGAQINRVLEFCLGAGWFTLRDVSTACGDPEASCSARLRDCRRMGFVVERKFVARGLWQYRVYRPTPS